MLTEEDDVEIRALARRGWSISAIARHTGRDRKTVRKYLAVDRPVREPAPSCLEPFRDYLVARFADDCREYDSWRRRHELPHAMLMDGAAHHFDMLRNLSGANCASIASLEWNPAWSSSRGEFNALCLLRMTTGAGAVYEGSATAAGQQNAWRQEYYRAECEAGSVTVDADQVVRIHRHTPAGGLRTEEVPLETPRYEGHEWIVHEFLDWLDAGPPPATVLEDNIHSAAMVFGAIEAAATRQWVDLASLMTGAPG
jgi:predicted dehydrogenase